MPKILSFSLVLGIGILLVAALVSWEIPGADRGRAGQNGSEIQELRESYEKQARMLQAIARDPGRTMEDRQEANRALAEIRFELEDPRGIFATASPSPPQ